MIVSLARKVMSDVTLSDGTFLPKDSFVSANLYATHRDPANYSDPNEFRPFRYSEMRAQDPSEATKHQMVNTQADYLSFGHGRHACPGRFFAVNELKVMMAYLILNYDMKMEVDGVHPESFYWATTIIPNPTAKIMFKKRARTN